MPPYVLVLCSGNHLVEVMYEGMAVGSGPYTVKAYDPTAIRVSNIANGMVGKPVEFESKYNDTMYLLEKQTPYLKQK